MDKLLFAFCITAYFISVIALVFKTKALIVDTPTVPNKIYAVACAVTYIVGFISMTSKINDAATISLQALNVDEFSFAALTAYIFFWFVFSTLYGSFLTVILFLPYTIMVFVLTARNPKLSPNKLPKPFNVEMWPSLYVCFSLVAYNIILIAFGLCDGFMGLGLFFGDLFN